MTTSTDVMGAADTETLTETPTGDLAVSEACRRAEAIMALAKREARAERARVIAKAEREAKDIVDKAHAQVVSERKKALVELSGFVVDLAVQINTKIIGEELSVEQQRHLAERCLREVNGTDVE